MAQALLERLLARRERLQTDMQVRLDELDQLIKLVESEPENLNPTTTNNTTTAASRRRRPSATTISDIIERPILEALMKAQTLTSSEIAAMVPGKRMGPLISAWMSRARAVNLVFEDLVTRSVMPDGEKAYSLTSEGRHVFSEVVGNSAKSASAVAMQPSVWPPRS